MPASSYFRSIEHGADRASFTSDAATTGPWSAGLQHGGPPSALLIHCAERAGAQGRDQELVAVRVADLEVTTRVVRAARTAVLVEAGISYGGRACLQGRVWLVRRLDTSDLVGPPPAELAVPPHETGLGGGSFPYHDTIAWHAVEGSMNRPGPGVVWARPGWTLLPGVELSGLQRTALVGDSASGISSELDWNEWSFVNVDLDVHLSRPVLGEWLRFDARTALGPAGTALARSTVSDVRGEVGTTAQTLVLAPRR